MAWILHYCGCGINQWLQRQLDPSLGTSIGCGNSPKKAKKKKKRVNTDNDDDRLIKNKNHIHGGLTVCQT